MNMSSKEAKPSPTQAITATLYRNRRRVATGSAMALAALLGYFAVAGENGITVYKQKRLEDRQLTKQIEQLKQENIGLQTHVDRLQNDPHAIEQKAREILHYTQPGEVIYTLPDNANRDKAAFNKPDADAPAQTGSDIAPIPVPQSTAQKQ
jgi:cell division protein FtsB